MADIICLPCLAGVPLPIIHTTHVLNAKPTPHWQTVGVANADHTITITSEINGMVDAVLVSDGLPIQKGTPILHLKSGTIGAQYKMAKAQYDLAMLKLERNETLFKKKVITAMAIDESRLGAEAAKQTMLSLKSQLNKTTIRAPFKGILDGHLMLGLI